MSSQGFSVELDRVGNGVGLLRFRDEGRQNQLCWAAVEALLEAVNSCSDQDIRVLVLSSDNPGHWFEHAWLADIEATMAGEPAIGDGAAWFGLMNALGKGPTVTIAAVNGDTCGGGCEVGWACDLRVAERQARFAQPEVRLGITPGVGGASRLSKLVGRSLAGEMVFGGQWTSAERIYQVGGINRLVETDEAREHAIEWARQLAMLPAEALRACKQVLAQTEELPLQEALMAEQSQFQATAMTDEARALMSAQQRYYDEGGTTDQSF